MRLRASQPEDSQAGPATRPGRRQTKSPTASGRDALDLRFLDDWGQRPFGSAIPWRALGPEANGATPIPAVKFRVVVR